MNEHDLKQFQEIVALLVEAEHKEPVVKPIAVEQLFDTLDLSLGDDALDEEVFYEKLKEIVMNTPRTASKYFFNQLYGGRRSKAVLGDLISTLLNTSMYTYKVAGPMVGVEKVLIQKICDLAGYGKRAGGTVVTGGSLSNLTAMTMARDKAIDKLTQTGVLRKMTYYTSAASHYSIEKNASIIGVGKAQVRYISTNKKGVMRTDELEKQIQVDLSEGFVPFFINATAGTTVMGAFDNIKETHKVAKKYGIWLHVDGAYCGGVIFSRKYRRLLEGLELSDSFCLNGHKMIGTPLTSSIIITQNKEDLYHSFSSDASYLYQTEEDEFNLGKTSLQCGRKNDALKFWTLWKSIGKKGIEQLIDHQFELADVARNYVRNNQDYQLYSFDDSISICFNYKNIPAQRLCTLLYEKAALMVSFGYFEGIEFVRFVTINSDNTSEDVLNFFKVLEQFVQENLHALTEETSFKPTPYLPE